MTPKQQNIHDMAQGIAATLKKMLPEDLGFVLLLVPKPDSKEKEGMIDLAIGSSFPEPHACMIMAETARAFAAKNLKAMGVDASELLDIDKLAKKDVREALEKARAKVRAHTENFDEQVAKQADEIIKRVKGE
jgi:kynurenine formamidase